jgi:hypothetical protein
MKLAAPRASRYASLPQISFTFSNWRPAARMQCCQVDSATLRLSPLNKGFDGYRIDSDFRVADRQLRSDRLIPRPNTRSERRRIPAPPNFSGLFPAPHHSGAGLFSWATSFAALIFPIFLDAPSHPLVGRIWRNLHVELSTPASNSRRSNSLTFSARNMPVNGSRAPHFSKRCPPEN